MNEQPKSARPDGASKAKPQAKAEKLDADGPKDHQPFSRTTKIIAGVCVLVFVWYLIADRITPFTGNARVKTFVVAITPQVSGYVTKVHVRNNEFVKVGQPLVQIDRRQFELAVRTAQAELESATQDVGAGSAAIKTAEAKVAEARSNLANVRLQSQRILALEKKGIMAKARGDQARAQLASGESALSAALSELEKAKQQAGVSGADNPRIRAALAALEQARLQLSRSTLKAPADGVVTDLRLSGGQLAASGQPVMTFIAIQDVWIEAYLTDNNLGNVRAGNRVEIAFDSAPGRVAVGEVVSLTVGAASGFEATPGQLQKVDTQSGWLRDPQRFPVVIKLKGFAGGGGKASGYTLRVNTQADVIVYTGGNWIMNAIGWLWIRIATILSFVY